MNLLTSRALVGLFLVLLGGGPALAMGGGPEAPPALDVNSVAADPGAYQGEIRVRGVVAKVAPEDSTFVLIDIREFRACGVVTCATEFVPVRHGGTLPKVKDEVVVIGEMVSSPEGYVLAGKELGKLEE